MIRTSPPIESGLVGVRLVLAITFLYLAAYALAPGSAVQLPITLLFVFVCPGLLLYDWVRMDGLASAVTLVVASSLAVNTLVTTTVVGLSDYTPFGGLLATAAVSVALAIVAYSMATRSVDADPDWAYQE